MKKLLYALFSPLLLIPCATHAMHDAHSASIFRAVNSARIGNVRALQHITHIYVQATKDVDRACSVAVALANTRSYSTNNHTVIGLCIKSRFKQDAITNALIDVVKTRNSSNTDVVATLLAAGADINGYDSCGLPLNEIPPLFDAVRNPLILKFLLDHGADVHQKSHSESKKSALHCAAIIAEKESIRILIAAGISVNIRDSHCKTPLHYAADGYRGSNFGVLLECGADPLLRDDQGWAPHDPRWPLAPTVYGLSCRVPYP